MPVEGRGLSSRSTQQVARDGKLGNLSIPESVQKLQTALQAKAKGNPSFRFYALYDKVHREDVLQLAYLRSKSNGGAAGVDGQEFEDIESYGREQWLGQLAQELREKKYQPQAVRRVFIPKRGGTGRRPLGIPSIRDRTVQMATVLVLGPIFEADLPPEQHAYRPERDALSAVKQVYKLLKTGHTKVIDADLAAYFDSIPHLELLQSVARRVVDRQMLHLIQMWLNAAVEESDKRGNKKRTTRNRDEKRGIPQGSPVTPLTQKVTLPPRLVLRPARRWRPAILRRHGRDGDAMADSDGVVTDQNLLDHEPHNSLPLNDIERVRSAAQTGKECRESLCQAQESGAIVGLVSDSLQLGP